MQISTVAGNTVSRDKIIHRCCKCCISILRWSDVLRTAMVGNSRGSSRDEEPVKDSGKAHYNVTVEKLIQLNVTYFMLAVTEYLYVPKFIN